MYKIQGIGRPKTYAKQVSLSKQRSKELFFVEKYCVVWTLNLFFLFLILFKMGIEKNIPKDQEEKRQLVQENQR